MITDERLKQLMADVGLPNSVGLMQALRQCDMEATLAERERCASICEGQRQEYEPHTGILKNLAYQCADAIRRAP